MDRKEFEEAMRKLINAEIRSQLDKQKEGFMEKNSEFLATLDDAKKLTAGVNELKAIKSGLGAEIAEMQKVKLSIQNEMGK